MLYIGLGDGGSANDPGNRAQDLGQLLGKILRIDPRPAPDGTPYTIPPDNPFVGTAGARGEIWSWGLRNPWRFSFDPANGDLWIGDVGQGAREEVDHASAPNAGKGLNFGWARLEGTRPVSGVAPPDAVPPVHEYDNPAQGCAVTGGHVYRGTAVPALVGRYVFADFCAGRLQAITPDRHDLRRDRPAGQRRPDRLVRRRRPRRALRPQPGGRPVPHRPVVRAASMVPGPCHFGPG